MPQSETDKNILSSTFRAKALSTDSSDEGPLLEMSRIEYFYQFLIVASENPSLGVVSYRYFFTSLLSVFSKSDGDRGVATCADLTSWDLAVTNLYEGGIRLILTSLFITNKAGLNFGGVFCD